MARTYGVTTGDVDVDDSASRKFGRRVTSERNAGRLRPTTREPVGPATLPTTSTPSIEITVRFS